MKRCSYYIALVFDTKRKQWFLEFGDYERETVKYELENVLLPEYGRKNVRLVHVDTDSQDAINETLRKINAEQL